MKNTVFAVAAFALCAVVTPASAQIIATSIPHADSGSSAASEKKFAFHLLAAPLAKWRINVFQEDAESITAARATPNSKFLAAGEIAFKAGSNVTVGVGGWFNKVGTADYEYATAVATDSGIVALAGHLDDDQNYAEGHINVFYKDIGIQGGFVRVSDKFKGLSVDAGTIDDVALSGSALSLFEQALNDTLVTGSSDSTTDTDGYLVYRHAFTDAKTPFTVSLGAGGYRYKATKKTVFSGFLTGSVDLYKGLGIDASFWYIGKSKSDTARDLDLGDNVSRITVGIGYSFSK